MLIVKLICLVLGTALTALFILFALRGRKEDWRIEGVPQKEFSDKELWAAGFAMQQLPVFSMDSAVGKKMMSASAILHPENGGRFVEYWARLYWARTLIEIAGPPDNVTLSNMAIKAINDNPAPAR